MDEQSTPKIPNKYRSDDISLIMGALAKAQGSYKPLIPNESAPGTTFANLSAILAAVRESLASNGLGFYQYVELLDENSGAALLKTILGHESGQYISSCCRIPGANNERTTANMLEIYKRLHALMILGVAPLKGDPLAFDDNGEQLADERLMREVRKPREQQIAEYDKRDVIDKLMYDDLMIELENYPEIAANIMDAYNITALADIPRSEYHKVKSKIFKIKKADEDYKKKSRP